MDENKNLKAPEQKPVGKPPEVKDESKLGNRPETNIPQSGTAAAEPGQPFGTDLGDLNSRIVPPYGHDVNVASTQKVYDKAKEEADKMEKARKDKETGQFAASRSPEVPAKVEEKK